MGKSHFLEMLDFGTAQLCGVANFGQRASKVAFSLFYILVFRGIGVRHNN
jgi:hypothetical protein